MGLRVENCGLGVIRLIQGYHMGTLALYKRYVRLAGGKTTNLKIPYVVHIMGIREIQGDKRPYLRFRP